MRVVSANLLALLFLCACASVFYVWNELDSRLERYKRRFRLPGAFSSGSSSADLPIKTFRALLAVPVAQRPRLGRRVEVHNLTVERDQTVSLGSQDYHLNGDNKGSAQLGVPADLSAPVEDGIFWSEWLEHHLSVGFSEEHARAWRDRARGHRIVKLEAGCGRISNQLATFADGTKACVRYGINADQVQGETLTYYLASLLGIANLPPLALAQLNVASEQWASVKRRIEGVQWSDRAVVSLTEWVSNLTGVVTPTALRQEGSGLHPLRKDLRNGTAEELRELMQWTDLILLDYMTANFDRLVSNLFSLQWDPRVMERETNNLLQTPSGDLIFIDNEAGLVHGYRVLTMWEKYHSTVLESVCVFRKSTAQRVAGLHGGRDVRTRLLQVYKDNEPLSQELGFLSDEHAGVLQDRIDRVYKHILQCKGKYSQHSVIPFAAYEYR